MTSEYDVKTAQIIRSWINDVLKNEAKESYDFDRFLDEAKDKFSKGQDMEGIYLIMHYNGRFPQRISSLVALNPSSGYSPALTHYIGMHRSSSFGEERNNGQSHFGISQ